MMTQPIEKFQKLTTEVSAGGNDLTKLGFSFDDRRLIERRARYARAAVVADSLTEAMLWLGRQARRVVDAIKADYKLRAAEAQLLRMSDRELADLGLSRAEIPFAVREAQVEGVVPTFDVAQAAHEAAVSAANRNERPAIFWAGRA
jgi:uncharacterized protein YjiS (DUF1127 family)